MKTGLTEVLDSLLLSNNVVDNFYNEYINKAWFKEELDKFLPEIYLCEKQKQDNPWHKYNVLGHILHAVEEMNKLTEGLDLKRRRLLAYVMFFHDIGKPACHIRRPKNGKMIDSFFNHNIRSAEIAKEKAPQLGFDKQSSNMIEKLVYKHDIFMFITEKDDGNKFHRVLSEDLITTEIEDMESVGDGKELFEDLILVGLADNYAQNEKMTTGSIAMLKKINAMLENIQHSSSI